MIKKIIIISAIIGLFFTAWVVGQNKPKKNQDTKKTENVVIQKSEKQATVKVPQKITKDHSKENINCKSCHDCEYPTKKDPCLLKCPRTDVSVYHSPSEGPEVILMDNLSKRYGPVVFSHKLHSQMSEMSHGCTGCHHYNTTGPVLNCKKCHEEKRYRKDITKPDLEAAYHRQCMNCHRQWSRTTDCNACHLPKGPEGTAKKDEEIKRITTLKHPDIPKPDKMVYQTNAEKGKIVTFFHSDHSEKFNIKCTSCHKDENCTKCHDANIIKANPKHYNETKKVHKTFDQHHQPCTNCHESKNCKKCHFDQELKSFNHTSSTGWDLGKNHSKLSCSKCHENGEYKKLNNSCVSCHKNFVPGKFDHKLTGLVLNENHKDLDCTSCHVKSEFNKIPVCTDCHDDKKFPLQLPGKKTKK